MPHFYHALFTVHGLLWYHSTARTITTPKSYSHSLLPVIHNYGLTLGLAGYLTDPDVGYVSVFGVTKYKPPVELYRRYGTYAYPALVTRPLLSELFMSAIGEALVDIKAMGKLAYPDTTKNAVLMPGSELETLIISEYRLPSTLVLRIGAKRYGVLRARLVEVKPKTVSVVTASHPYNVSDVGPVPGSVVLLKHPAGDIAYMGTSDCLSYTVRVRSRAKRVFVPALRGLEDA